MTNLLITGTGGIGGINFVRALRLSEEQGGTRLFILGTDHNPYYLQFPDVDVRFVTPRHDDPSFVPTLLELAEKHDIEFLHLHPSSEARVVSENQDAFKDNGVITYLPRASSIMPDKLEIFKALSARRVPAPQTWMLDSLEDVDEAFSEMEHPLWLRAAKGAGGRLSLKVDTPEEAKLWMKLNALQDRADIDEFILQEYLPGRDLAFDSLWFKGKLITSYARERLEYPFKHLTLSGITGTPTIARTIKDDRVNTVGTDAVRALDPEPHGFFSVDIKEDKDGNPVVTEVDGKWHTTAPLWGFAFAKAFEKPAFNMSQSYLTLGLEGKTDQDLPAYDLFPADYYLIRQLDAGVILQGDDRTCRVV